MQRQVAQPPINSIRLPYNGRMRFLFRVTLILLPLLLSAQTSQIPAPPDVAAPPADVTKNKSGLVTKEITPGTGQERPGKDDVVTVNYNAWSSDGKLVTSTIAAGKPATIAVKRMLPGLAEGVQLMSVGETRRIWVPESLAFKGQQGKPKGTIVFDVTLLEVPTHAPADLKKPDEGAIKTRSGLAYKILREGTGTRHPTKFSTVTVNYTGWSTDGKMFDSSLERGAPSTFPLDRVIPGWTEGLQLMTEGEKARFWIPQDLAYQGKQPPYGMLVFDIELLNVQ
jgi:peptidylprolyl isomerase